MSDIFQRASYRFNCRSSLQKNSTSVFKSLILLAGILLALDAVYLSSTAGLSLPVYRAIQGAPIQIHYGGALACYVLMTMGLYYFIIRDKRPLLDAFLLGIFVYGVYDMTTLALFRKYILGLAVMDMLWGGVLFGATTWIYRWIFEMFCTSK